MVAIAEKRKSRASILVMTIDGEYKSFKNEAL